MKKILITLVVLFAFCLCSFTQQVEEIQRTLLTKRSATWCPPCGGWGWDMFDHLIEDNEGKAVLLAAHHSGELWSMAAEEITDNWTAFSQPRFFLNEIDQNATSGNWQSKAGDIKNQVDDAFNQAPVANTGLEAYYGDDLETHVNAKVKFFQAASGDFYLGVYLIENNVINFQQGQGNDANHAKILRTAFTPNTFGVSLANGDVGSGQEFDHSFSMATGDPAMLNYEIVAIIWEKVGSKFEVLNVFMTNNFDGVSGTGELNPDFANLLISPTVSKSVIQIELNLNQYFDEIELAIFDLLGRRVITLLESALMEGAHYYEILKSDVGSAGTYIAKLKIGNQTINKPLIFK